MTLSDILDGLSDGAMIKVSAVKPLISSDADINECYIGLVREFERLNDFIFSCFIGILVFDYMLDIFVDFNFSDGHNL